MARFIYEQHHIEFLIETYAEYGVADTARLFNAAFGLNKSTAQIKSTLKNHHITCGRKTGELNKGKLRAFTEEQKQWIENAYKKMSLAEMTLAFNKRFGLSKTESQIRCFTRNHKIRSGRTGCFEKGREPANKGIKGWQAGGRSNQTQFRKGNVPHNHQPVGTEVTDRDGYRKVKVSEPNKWAFVHRLAWEKHNGPIPEGQFVRFIDGNSKNCDIENLTLVDRGAHAILNRWSAPLSESNPDLRPSIIGIAKLQSAIKKRSKLVSEVAK
ncbi:HNH endonuclease signature motif containing protein [Idiomarina sp.]|uniref:HNH endonuclease signature motif containing protein n=1 Tax=Idiomarina sp. TaxID=1874361 RepID=UPI003A8F6B59